MTLLSDHFWLENTVTERIVFFMLWQEKTDQTDQKINQTDKFVTSLTCLCTENMIWQGFACHCPMMMTIPFIKMIGGDCWSVTFTSIDCQSDCIFPVISTYKNCHWTHSFLPGMTSKNLSSWQVCDDPGFSVHV